MHICIGMHTSICLCMQRLEKGVLFCHAPPYSRRQGVSTNLELCWHRTRLSLCKYKCMALPSSLPMCPRERSSGVHAWEASALIQNHLLACDLFLESGNIYQQRFPGSSRTLPYVIQLCTSWSPHYFFLPSREIEMITIFPVYCVNFFIPLFLEQ